MITNYMHDADEYTISESDEITSSKSAGIIEKLLVAFPAFHHKNYRLYFLGQLVSFVGTWVQIVAQGWLIVKLTNSALALGVITALGTLPVLCLSLFAGVIVDRFQKKQLLLLTNGSFFVLTMILGGLTIIGKVDVLNLSILVFLIGIVDALDKPTRHSFIPSIVDKENLASAIALNSAMYNSARIIGPVIASAFILIFGIGGAFIINAISYGIAFFCFFFITAKEVIPHAHEKPLSALKEGIMYAWSHSAIKTLLLLVAISSIFGWSYTTIIPVVAINIFHQNESGYAYLFSAAGVGAVCATIFISAFSKRIPPLFFILGGNFLFTLSLLIFSFTTNFPFALFLLFLAGTGLIAQFSVINSTIQHTVSDAMRGRVMSIYIFMFVGLLPLGSFQIGLLSQYFGSQVAIRVGALIVLLFGVYLFLKRFQLAKEIEKHTTT